MQTTGTIPASMPPRVLLSLEEVATSTGLSRAHLYRLIGSGQLRSIKIGRRRLIPVAALMEFCERLAREEVL